MLVWLNVELFSYRVKFGNLVENVIYGEFWLKIFFINFFLLNVEVLFEKCFEFNKWLLFLVFVKLCWVFLIFFSDLK